MLPLTKSSPYPKRHLDRFSRFCAVYGTNAYTLQLAALSPAKLLIHMENLDLQLTHGSLGPPESMTQTTPQSVQPFLQGLRS